MASSVLFRSVSKTAITNPGIKHSQWKSSHGPITLIDFDKLGSDSVKGDHGNHMDITVMTSNGTLGTITHLDIETDIVEFIKQLDAMLGENKSNSHVILVGNIHTSHNGNQYFYDALVTALKNSNYSIRHEHMENSNHLLPIKVTLYRDRAMATKDIDDSAPQDIKPAVTKQNLYKTTSPNRVLRRVSLSDLKKAPLDEKRSPKLSSINEQVTEIPFNEPLTKSFRREKSLPQDLLAVNAEHAAARAAKI